MEAAPCSWASCVYVLQKGLAINSAGILCPGLGLACVGVTDHPHVGVRGGQFPLGGRVFTRAKRKGEDLPFLNCVTLGRLCNDSVPWFPHCKMGIIVIPALQLSQDEVKGCKRACVWPITGSVNESGCHHCPCLHLARAEGRAEVLCSEVLSAPGVLCVYVSLRDRSLK